MAVLGKIADIERFRRADVFRICIAALVAFCFHLLLFLVFMTETPEVFEVKEDIIAVELVVLPPKAQTVDAVPRPPEIEEAPLPLPPPIQKVKPRAPSPPKSAMISEAPEILTSPRPAASEDVGNTVPPTEQGAVSEANPQTSSADEIRIDEGLKSLAAELTCLNGFSTECADIRKDVFEDFQMTETDKVYTKKYAHTGMPVEFYGMSERQIRAKLNVPNAGENGLYIPFTKIGIDGGIWDMIHGVNKGCSWKVSIDKKGNHGAIKDCPDYLPAAKEDRDRRNKFQARLKANEIRRKDEGQP